MKTAPPLEPLTAKLYFAAQDAAQAKRIVAQGFKGIDNQVAKLPYGDPTFVDQPGIIASSGIDPTTGLAVEIEFTTNATFLRRHELISPVQGVRYYVLIDCWDSVRLREVSTEEMEAAKVGGLERWQHRPLLWFGKE